MHMTFPFFTNRPAPPPVSDDMMPRGPAEKNAVKLLQGGLLRSTKRLQSALGSTGAWTVNLTHQYHLDIPCTKWSCGTQLDLGSRLSAISGRRFSESHGLFSEECYRTLFLCCLFQPGPVALACCQPGTRSFNTSKLPDSFSWSCVKTATYHPNNGASRPPRQVKHRQPASYQGKYELLPTAATQSSTRHPRASTGHLFFRGIQSERQARDSHEFSHQSLAHPHGVDASS